MLMSSRRLSGIIRLESVTGKLIGLAIQDLRRAVG